MKDLYFTVTTNGALLAAFARIADAESFAVTQPGHVEVRSAGDGYVYLTVVDGRELVS